MNRYILFLTAITITNLVIGQDSVTLKLEYQPGRIYHVVSKMQQNVSLKFVGPPAYLDSLKKSGSPDTKSVLQEIFIVSDLKTAREKDSTGRLGVDLVFNKMKIGDDSTSLPPGLTLKGIVSPGSIPEIVSVESDKIDETTRDQIKQMCVKLFSQVTLPLKTMKKGDSYLHEVPFRMPLGTVTLAINIVTKYTLTDNENGLANFLIEQKYTMIKPEEKNSIVATGEGNGQMVYDMKETFIKLYRISTDMQMHIDTGRVDVTEDLKGYTELNYSISKSN